MRACGLVALLMAGCLAVPPDPVAGDADPGGGDGDHPETPGEPDARAGCAEGSELDLVWVNEVAFDLEAQDRVTLPGVMILVNRGPGAVALGSLEVLPSEQDEAVAAEYSLSGSDLVLSAGEAMGALNVGAAGVVTSEFDEEWTNLDLPELEAVLTFDGSARDAVVPLHLQLGGFHYEVSILVRHDPDATGFTWARDAARTSAVCEE
jgi:hypothetical protein